MLKNILVIFSVIAAAYGAGQMTIVKSSKNILFKRVDKLDASQVGQVLNALTGHSITESVPLKMQITSPFDLTQYVCLINIEGIKDFTLQNSKSKSDIEIVGGENSIDVFTSKLYEEGLPVVNVQLNDGLDALSSLQDWCETPLKPENSKVFKSFKDEKNAESKRILEAIAVLNVLAEAKCTFPTFLQFDLNVSDLKSRDKHLDQLVPAVEALAQGFERNTNGNGFLAVFTADEQPLKRTRRAATDNNDLNLAGSYSEDYPVIFNIILWFGVTMVFATLAIAYAIGTMDPGRDSIIYRMTSTRIKKDN